MEAYEALEADQQSGVEGNAGGAAAATSSTKTDYFYKPWDKFTKKKSKTSSKSSKSLDRDEEGVPSHHPDVTEEGVVINQSATTSYEEAAAACKAKVDAIVAECSRLNIKYDDRHFDLANNRFDCLVSLDPDEMPSSFSGLGSVGSVKRVEDIYEKPQFFIDGVSANDVKQGYVGDCWFLAAITALSGKPELLEKVCVARDEKVGVYGFVFYRDGEWISEIVDDRLCLKPGDDNTKFPTEYKLNVFGDKSYRSLDLSVDRYYITQLPKEFRENLRKGSNALYFSSCRDSNETWLPLLEKAYAKAHGDYQAIEGGFTGEGIEDLTGGVAVMLPSEDVLDKDRLWSELMQVNKNFLFGCGSRLGHDSDPSDEEGFVRGHAYTVLEAREIQHKGKDVRLLKIRNPWGQQEWNGAWSDGSKEWTPESLKELGHTFGDDGIFWISYQDYLKYYPDMDRIRLFGPEWTVAQQWTSVEVPYTEEYLETKFTLSVKKKSSAVIVLSQPDERYFRGLSGRYMYQLHFRVYKEGEKRYMLRSMASSGSGRSCPAELELEPGNYTILVKVNSGRNAEGKTPENVMKEWRGARIDKLLAVGRSFDLVHSKGNLREAEKENALREKREAKAKSRAKLASGRDRRKRDRERERRRKARIEAAREKKKAAKKAEKKAAEEEKKKKQAESAPVSAVSAAAKTDEVEKTEKTEKEEEEKAPVSATESTSKNEDEQNKDKEPEKQEAKSKLEVVVSAPSSASKKSIPSPIATASSPIPISPTTTKSPSTQNIPTPSSTSGGSEDKKEDDSKEAATSGEGEEEKHVMDHKEMATELREIATQLDAEQAASDDDDDNISVSDVDDDDFDWDSEIDGSEEDSDDSDDDSNDDMYADDPWKAICVMGLKVYHIDAGIEIGVSHK